MNAFQTQLTVAKREQLLRLAKSLNLRSKAAPLPAITRVERGETVPLSFAQQRLWFLAQMEGGSKAYHVPVRMRLRGELNVAALKQALDRIVARHEALRTTFTTVEGEPQQRIAPVEESGFQMQEQDLRQHEDAGGELERVVAEEVGAGFDMERGPLIRGRLIRLGEQEHVLLISMHHIVTDGWSLGVLFKELSELYGAYVRGAEDPLPELEVQYADYAVWQRKWMEGEALREQAEYWKKNLAGVPELLELPADHVRPARQDYAGGTLPVMLNEKLTAGLKELSARHGTTLYMTLLAAWAVLLGRLSGQEDVVIGTLVANRGRVEIENLIGFFVNTLVLRVDVSGSPTVRELLARVKRQVIAAQQHQEIPFEPVLEIVSPVRSLAHSPLFQVLFTWHTPEGQLELAGLEVTPVEIPYGMAKFDLTLTLQEAGKTIEGGLQYATGLFERATIDRYSGYFCRLLEAAVCSDAQVMDRLPMLGEEERREIVHEWNATAAEYPSERCVHELFEEQVGKSPDAVALVYEEASLSYGELNRRANRLAHYLRAVGVRPDARVGICVERSLEMVVGILGILKAGGAYVPLDPAYPAERLQFMVEDSAPAVLLTQKHLQGLFSGIGESVRVLDLMGGADAWSEEPETNPDPAAIGLSSEHLAYITYTSGSTGTPKAVMAEHRAVCSLIVTQVRLLAVESASRVLQFASLSFDASTPEIWNALCGGAALYVSPQGAILIGEALRQVIKRSGITHAKFPPTVLATLPESSDLDSLGTLMVSAEILTESLAKQWLPGRRLINLYGPTETTVHATLHDCDDQKLGSPPIGRPIANKRAYILDKQGEPVPVGVAGELYIGGAGVSRGYLNGTELTADRFVPDPFSTEPGERMYRTGDLARWLRDGAIEFIGRNDQQVKVRGYRIELGEIEERLGEHAGVREAVVVPREESGDKRLVAYYTAQEEQGADEIGAEVLRGYLARKLPEYMVPTAYVRLESIPLTPNGKLDRKRLPAPEGDAYAVRRYEAPEGEIETILAGIWAEVLKIERVGRQDNFFALGGHSLLVMRVTSRIRQVLGVEVKISNVFAQPVLSDFARVVESARQSGLPAITRAERGETVPLSFAQQRLWFLAQMEGGSKAYHVPLGMRLRGELNVAALKQALDRIVARHEALRTSFAVLEGEPEQRIAPVEESRFQLQEQDLREHEDAGGELERMIAEERGAGFDMERGPLIRGRLIRLGEQEHALLISMHHIVSDGWSMGVLFKEMSVLYGAYAKGEQDRLPELGVQYADYAVWQRKWMEGEVLGEQAEYWKKNLAGVPEVLELPADHVRPARQDYAGSVVELVLEEKLTAGLKELSGRHGTTLYMTLLAGWAVLLSRLSGQQDVVIGTPVANRGRVEIENLIGFFVNTLVMRVDVSGRPTVRELLARVKRQAVAAQQHQDIPFEQVVELVQPVRSLAHSPLFQVMFAWQDAAGPGPKLLGLEIEPPHSTPHGVSRFDLTVALREFGGHIEGVVEYATGLFERETVERYLGYFTRLLEGMIAGGESQAINGIAILGEQERQQVVYEWSKREMKLPAGIHAHELFDTNPRVYILDEQREPVPVGVVGELYIGGAGVGGGYLNRSEETWERFFQDRFVEEGEARMYGTGELGRWRKDGTMEILGGKDCQVKIRGQRIEVGEIEVRLEEHPDLLESVVVGREEAGGEKRLVAYYTVAEPAGERIAGREYPRAEELRDYLSQSLPEYMVPAAYVRLEKLPLTGDGKVDRKALPALEEGAFAVGVYEPPEGEIETMIAGIWADVLKVEAIGRRDNFFTLGGRSLLAVQVAARLRQGLGLEVGVDALFAWPVLSDFARVVESARQTRLPAITRAERGGRLPLSFAQQRLWFLAQMEGVSRAYQVRLGMRLRGELNVAALKQALDRIVARHEALRTTFAMVEGEPEQRIAPVEESRFQLQEQDLREHEDAGGELERVIAEEAGAGFDMERGPLIRGRLIRLGEQEHALLISMHHIVSDGWSMGVLFKEMSVLYGAYAKGEQDRLPELGVQYADYAVWQRKWMEGEVLGEQAEYWKKNLAGVPEVLELPADHVRPARQDYAGSVVELVLEEKLTAGLKELSGRHGTTLYMTLLAGWAVLLSRLSGQQDVVIGTPVANRRSLEIESLIGFFVNMLVARIDISGSPTVEELLQRVKRQALAAQQHQDIPFEQVVELVQPVRSLAHSPLFQTAFGWQDAVEGKPELPGLGTAPLPSSPHVVSKFDLTLSLQETGGRIEGAVEYATGLFERETVERYLGYFTRLLEGMIAGGESQAINGIAILGEQERQQVVYEWSKREMKLPAGIHAHELFDTNPRVYILDEQREPVPVGVVGELYIGGAGVGGGYLNRSEETWERFFQDRFVEEGEARMYGTGELGRWRKDGTMEILGGKDCQVKIRGQRIEVGEIEVRLEEHPDLLESVVVGREEAGGEKRLVAYYTVAEPAGERIAGREYPRAEELRDYLSQSLPEYMVPAAYVRLEKLPLTGDGKVDRKALPALEEGAFAVGVYEPPEGEIETMIAGIWADVLKVEAIGRRDNFFTLGGRSLLAVQVAARLRQGLGLEVGVDALFAWPVLSDFARVVESARQTRLPAITRAERGGRLPLSFAQQRLWFLAQMEGVSRAYQVRLGMRLRGELNVAALKQALDRIVARHEALRTTFAMVEGEPEQRIAPVEESRFQLQEQDLREHEDAGGELERVIAEEAGAGFDMERGPLIRGRLIRLGEQEHALLISMHHIVSDGWSMGVLFKEMSVLYGAYAKGEQDRLPELGVQYADYAVWQRKWMEGEVLGEQAEYWKKNLAGVPEVLELPADHVRPARQDYAGSVVELVLEEKLTAGLKELSGRHGTTLYMTLLAGWAVLLSRLSGQQDVVIGTPVANRGRVEIENLIGFFVNTLVMRVDVSGRPTVRELLARVKRQAVAAQQHQDIPFEQVVELVQPVRSLAHSPLFQVMFAWQDAMEPELPGLEMLWLGGRPHFSSQFDMSMSLAESKQCIVGAVEYGTALFKRDTVERYLEYLTRLLEGMVATGEMQSVDELVMLGEEERRRVLYEWNRTETEYRQRCVHELFEEQEERTPNAVAVVCGEKQLSYAELNGKAERLARYLVEAGVERESRVGICLGRSLEIMIGILGVLKAGGAYVPLGPGLPKARLQYMLEDAGIEWVLVESAGLEKLPLGGVDLVLMDGAGEDAHWLEEVEAGGREEREKREVSAGDLAYILYTSGSTGQPKGVMVEHGELANYVGHAVAEYVQGGSRDSKRDGDKGEKGSNGEEGSRSEQEIVGSVVSTPLCFDATLTVLLPPLMVGKRVELLEEGEEVVEQLAQRLFRGAEKQEGEKKEKGESSVGAENESGSHAGWLFKITPAHLEALEYVERPQAVSEAPHCIVIGGEQLGAQRLLRWKRDLLPNAIFVNEYGPTETVVGCSVWKLRDEAGEKELEGQVAVPIGRPIGNTQLYVVGEGGQLQPVNSVGELWIGGAGVGRGYVGREELTRERFVEERFSGKAAEGGKGRGRLYRSGDLVRWLGSGELQFVGRRDDQVKVRGYRIELGEIEQQIAGLAGVAGAAVVVREDGAGGKRLVAYIVPEGAAGRQELEIAEIRQQLQQRLPEYMVPGVYVQLEKLPLTGNGKVDRKSLPAPEGDAYGMGRYEAPEGEIETIVAGIWADVLKVEAVGRRDNFFALGGHSLLVVRVTSRIRQALGVEVKISDMFAQPVLSDFARVVERARQTRLPAITRAERGGRLPLSFAQQRLWFLAQMEGGSKAYHVPLGMRLRGELNVAALKQALDRIVARHEALRTSFAVLEGEPEQRIAPVEESRFQLQEQDLREHEDAGGELERMIAEERGAGFDMERGPLIRGRLIRLGEQEHALLISMHHIVSDGWSMGVLFKEMSVLYGAYAKGEQDRLPELGVQYADYAVWQRKWMEGEVLGEQAEYWKKNLAGVPEVLELPADRVRPARQDYAGGALPVRLSEKLTAGLKELSGRHGTTLYMTLLAGWAVLLSRLSGQQDVVIGTPVANRGRVEIENLIGFFVNTLVMRVDVSGRPTVGEMLQRAKRQALAAQQHQDIPFEHVVELVQPVRSLAHSPLFQAVFAWQDAQGHGPELPGLEIAPIWRRATGGTRDEIQAKGDDEFCLEQLSSHVVSKFDLTVALQESEGHIEGAVEYATGLFERETVERYLGYFTRLLEGMIAGGESQAINGIAILGEQERQQVVYEWSKREMKLPAGIHAHELFDTNPRVYILDEQREPVPVGVVGELYIGGAGVGGGYLNRSEETWERFFQDRFVEEGEARMYGTGELGRWRKDGTMEILGGKDCQVKIRGQRIEVGEIEVRLEEHPDLLESVVVGREEAGGEKRLVAYYTVAEPAGERIAGREYPRAEELRDYLSQSLPEYMVPAAYVRLEKLPLTGDGKVDRKALPALEEGAFAVGVYEPPEGEIETMIAGIWADVLKVEAIGRRDNFFTLGGRSLLAVQVAARLRQGLGLEVGVDALFAWPVLSDFARVVESARQSGLSAITRANQGEQFPTVTRDLCAEAVLDANIAPVSQTPAATPAENIFLTGASGFLGSFLLADLLKRTQATVYCLVRSSTPDKGMATLSAKLKSFDLWDAATLSRIVAVPGDISKPLLGLSLEQFETMADVIDAVYHSAAMVNAAYAYDFIKSANVLGTQEIIRMACLGRRKALHHISTLSVFPAFLHPEEVGPVTEETLLERWQELPDGYSQSKWVAERLVQAAGSRGVPFAIYRPCFISGSLQSGAGNPDDFLSLFIMACLRLGCAPYTDMGIDDDETGINMLPVDYMSRAILALSQREEVLGRSLNLMHEKSMSFRNISDSLVSWGQSYGFPIKKVSFESWRAQCHATAELNALQIFFPAPANKPAPQSTGPRVEVEMDLETHRLLQAEGMDGPSITQELMKRYITYLAKSMNNGQLGATV